ncbi:MAG: hypothetical protein NC834_02585 [Candidatus Omnitrophica bacterium]|nr:hypothetical protein [Candidatus Omnitrophota bacterium]
MKTLFILILALLLTPPLAFDESTPEFLPLEEGNYWVYQDQIEIQDINGEFEVYNEYIGEKVRVKRINGLRTLKVLSTEERGEFKIAKMQEDSPDGIKIFFYVVDNKEGGIYSYSEEEIKRILPNDKDVIIDGTITNLISELKERGKR